MKISPRIIGKEEEELACEYLQQQKLHLISKNYCCKCGELDLVMQDQEMLVFVEVRYRQANYHGSGIDSITSAKQKRIIRTAQHFLLNNRKYRNWPCRFDVVGIATHQGSSKIEWIKDAFWVKW